MSEKHDEYADWDAAYVLGALSTHDRAAYEQHLSSCPECAEAVRGLAVIPGLLGRVPPEEVPGETVDAPPADLLARTRQVAESEVTRLRRRRRWAASLVAVAASAVLLVGGLAIGGALWAHDETTPGVTVAMQQVHANPLSATLRLRDRPWGTEVEMKCTYTSSGWGNRNVYALYVVDDDGHATSISTWSAAPGSTSELTAATAVPRARIAHLQIRTAGGQVLLTANPD